MFKMITVFFLAVTMGIANAEEVDTADSCLQPGRITPVCYQMKHLRSHVNLLDADRDLARVDFDMMASVSESVYQMITKLMVSNHYNEHLRGLGEVRDMARQLKEEATNRNFQSFRTANMMKQTCNQCHSQSAESTSGHSWDEIFGRSWDAIVQRCNTVGHNPYICRNMYAMSTAFSYFETAIPANHLDFELAEHTAKNLKTIASGLETLGGGIHEGGLDPIREVRVWAEGLETLAKRRDPYVYQRSLEVKKACSNCHEPR
jgi:hypothetical protein